MPPRIALALGCLCALGLGLSVAAARSVPTTVLVEVPGARTLAVYCGGDTVHADGSVAEVRPTSGHCYVEAPFTPVMPLQGEFRVTSRATIRCNRDNARLVCE